MESASKRKYITLPFHGQQNFHFGTRPLAAPDAQGPAVEIDKARCQRQPQTVMALLGGKKRNRNLGQFPSGNSASTISNINPRCAALAAGYQATANLNISRATNRFQGILQNVSQRRFQKIWVAGNGHVLRDFLRNLPLAARRRRQIEKPGSPWRPSPPQATAHHDVNEGT